MKLLAQHGYGKASKVDHGLDANDIGGVILSPKAESMEKLIQFSYELGDKHPTAEVYFDPQFYICGLQGETVPGKLIGYPYYEPGLTRAKLSSPQNLHMYADDAINIQRQLNISSIISPSIVFDDFDGQSSQTAISLAYESISLTDAENELYVTLCIGENAFRNRDSMEDFLNVISLLDVKGFYIIIERNQSTGKPTIIDNNILTNVMHFLFTLSIINEYDIIVGYSDLLSIPLAGICNASFASGWYNTLKSFSISNYRPSTGGRRPRKRYTSGVLMSSLLLFPEVNTLKQVGLWPNIQSSSPYNNIIEPNLNEAEWTDEVSCLHNWHVINSLLTEINGKGDISSRLNYICQLIDHGIHVYNSIDEAGIPLDFKSSNGHFTQWLTAIEDFRSQAGI